MGRRIEPGRCVVRHEAMGLWWSSVPKEPWPDHPDRRQHIAKFWDVCGDRRQEIVFIGTAMDEVAMRKQLYACLVRDTNDNTMQPSAWKNLEDPFPIWKRDKR